MELSKALTGKTPPDVGWLEYIIAKKIRGGGGVLFSSFSLWEPPTVPDTWVTDASGRILDITDAQFFALFYDSFVGTQPDGMVVTKTSLGLDESGTCNIYEYDFKPKNYTHTILLSSGMHAYELSASFGLAFFINHMMTNPALHGGFDRLLKSVRVKVIPILNPWGWNQNPKKYGNVNGVNINRNFDYDGAWEAFPVYSADPEDANYNEWNVKGTAPFSESETQIARDWILANSAAIYWIDCHTGLGLAPKHNFIYHMSTTPLIPKIYKALEALENRIVSKYAETPTRDIVINSPGSIRHQYSHSVAGVPTMTVEQTPNSLTWGTALNNDGGDISEYEVVLSAYVFEFISSSPAIYSTYADLSVDDDDVVVIPYTVSDLEGGLFTATYTIDAVSTSVSGLSIGVNTWTVGELAEGTHAVTFYVTDSKGYVSNTLSYSIVSTAASGPVVIIADTFTRADSTTIGQTEVGGKTWTPGLLSGWEISSGKVVANTVYLDNTLICDIGVSNYDVSVDIIWQVYAGITFRYIDNKNKMLVRINSSSVSLFRYINNVSLSLGNYSFVPTAGQEYNLRVVSNGADITVYLDGVERITVSDTTHNTGTKIALRTANDITSTFDNVEIKTV